MVLEEVGQITDSQTTVAITLHSHTFLLQQSMK